MKHALLVVLCCLTTPTWAGWNSCPGVTTNTSTDDARLQPSSRPPTSARDFIDMTCLRQATATDPARVNTIACREGVDVIFFSDVAGANYDATLQVYQCPATGTAGTFTDCEKVLPAGVDVLMTGNPVGSLDAIYGITPGWLAFDVTNGSSRTLEVRVVCR